LSDIQGWLIEDEIENAQNVIDISALGGFSGNPSLNQPVGKVKKSPTGCDAIFLELGDIILPGIFYGDVEIIDLPKELVTKLLNDGCIAGHFARFL
jgi:hypothetical protein